MLVAVIAGSVVVGGGGVVATSWVKSPQEALAEREAPEPSVLTAVVEERVLSDTVVTRGTVAVSGIVPVTAVASGDGRSLVTDVRVSAGEEVSAGDVLVEVSGRPVYVLPGEVPAYRDLRPGAEGDDIAQFQHALSDLGFDIEPDGVFGPRTKDTVRRFYESIGYPVLTTGDEASVSAASDAVKTAERALELAEREEDRLKETADEAAEAAAEADEQCDRDSETTGGDSAEDASTEGDGRAQSCEQVVGPSDDELDDAAYNVEVAKEDLADARTAYTDAMRVSGTVVRLGEFVYAPKLPALVHQVEVGIGDEVAGQVATLSTGDLVVRAKVDASTRHLLDKGMAVEVLSERRDMKLAGEITKIGEFTDDGESAPGHVVTIGVDDEIPRDLAGADVRITMVAASTEDEVLVVPLSAVSAAADGTTVVMKVDPLSGRERVVVTAGVSGDGYVEVRPSRAGALAAGDEVVVGS